MDYSRPELADRLAAEYAAGTLRGPARRRFEALLPAHPMLRQAVREWHEKLMPLTTVLAEQVPPERVWQRIEARIAPAGAAAPAAVPAPASGWWASLGLWRGLSSLATAAAVGLAVLLANPSAEAPVVVVLASTEQGPDGAAPARFVASFSADGRAVATRPLVPVSLAPGRALELWAVPTTGAPRSLGLISADGASVVQRSRVLKDTAALAVSLEPAGGSTTGAPSGPILFVGKLST
jgi:anti-sigma-K factor RskA